ncbi:hypothetical protein [Rhodococcus sp. UNC363MFTsu5.1]|nr:hypothetical protein [Rhodococcus sp. UNC363MFTsu5.1]
MPSLHDQIQDVLAKIRQARRDDNLAALAVLEPQMARLLDQLPRTGRT